MPELAQIGVTDENLECLDLLKDQGIIDELQEGARIAAAIAIRRKLYKGYDLMNVGKNLRTRWNTSLVDPDNFLRTLIKQLDLNVTDLGIALRSLIILGLDHIYSKVKDKEFATFGEFLNG
jgi:hypothetical protein